MRIPILWLLLLTAVCPAFCAETYRDPQGRFIVTYPDGWQSEANENRVLLVKDDAAVQVFVMPETPLDGLLDKSAAQLAGQWKEISEVSRSTGTVAGREAVHLQLKGVGPNQVETLCRISAFTRHGLTVAVYTTAPRKDFEGIRAAAESIERSIRVGADVPAPPEPPSYQDPQGRFKVILPQGWTASENAAGATISRGEAGVTVTAQEGSSSARDAIEQSLGELRKQWRNLEERQRGLTPIGQTTGVFALFTGTNPEGNDAVLRVSALEARNRVILLVFRAPRAEWQTSRDAFGAIERGLSVAGVGAGLSPSRLRASLGIATRPFTADDAATGARQGAVVDEVVPDSPAAGTGIRKGDVVVAIDRQLVRDPGDVTRAIGTYAPGDTLQIVAMRDGHPVSFVVKLGAR